MYNSGVRITKKQISAKDGQSLWLLVYASHEGSAQPTPLAGSAHPPYSTSHSTPRFMSTIRIRILLLRLRSDICSVVEKIYFGDSDWRLVRAPRVDLVHEEAENQASFSVGEMLNTSGVW